jgi:hypothetical protein
MEITATKTLNLEPIGDVQFRFDKSKRGKGTLIWIGEVDVQHGDELVLTEEQNKALVIAMKKAGTDLLTDGKGKFYTTTQYYTVTPVAHPAFDKYLFNKDA